MNYPIVKIKTRDKLELFGLFLEAGNTKTAYLHIHGTASNFYEEGFIQPLAESLIKNKISFLSANNRDAEIYNAWQESGTATEKFADSAADIDGWVKFLVSGGYRNIILSGHSLGTEKTVYYMNKGRLKKYIKAMILLAPSNSFGYQYRWGDKKVKKLLKISEVLIKKGQGSTMLPWDAYAWSLPKTAASFYDFLRPDSELLKALPFHLGQLEYYRRINIPILAAIGNQQEFTGVGTKKALALLKKENKLAVINYLPGCNHDFENCERKLTKFIIKFIVRIKLIKNEKRNFIS